MQELESAVSRILAAWETRNTGESLRRARGRARVAGAWRDVIRYRTFVAFALEDRDRWGAVFRSNVDEQRRLREQHGGGSRELTGAEFALLLENARLSMRLHFALESFYVFGKVLLDRTALAIEATFGNTRGIGLSSHGVVWREHGGLRAYAEGRALRPPSRDLIRRARRLERTLTTFRDHRIVHAQNVRVGMGTWWDASGAVDLAPGIAYPTDNEATPAPAPRVNELVSELDGYLHVVTRWVERNLALPVP